MPPPAELPPTPSNVGPSPAGWSVTATVVTGSADVRTRIDASSASTSRSSSAIIRRPEEDTWGASRARFIVYI